MTFRVHISRRQRLRLVLTSQSCVIYQSTLRPTPEMIAASEYYLSQTRHSLGCTSTVIRDALIFIVTIVVWGILQSGVAKPHVQGFFRGDRDIGFPSSQKSQTVDVPALIVLALLVPVVVIVLYNLIYGYRSRKWFIANQVIFFLLCAFLNDIVTNALKLMVGRLRPDFLDRCKPNYTDYPPDPETGYVGNPAVCTGSAAEIEEGRKSFPSGHSSIIMCGMIFLALYFHRAVPQGHEVSHAFRPMLQVLCITTGLVVGASRVYDHMHNPSDVIIGGIIGTVFGLLPYIIAPLWFGAQAFPSTYKSGEEKTRASTSWNPEEPLNAAETSDL